jgi:hypothetical protein
MQYMKFDSVPCVLLSFCDICLYIYGLSYGSVQLATGISQQISVTVL